MYYHLILFEIKYMYTYMPVPGLPHAFFLGTLTRLHFAQCILLLNSIYLPSTLFLKSIFSMTIYSQKQEIVKISFS